jgi:hypothetical protein
MGILITVIGLAILVVLAAIFIYLTSIEKLIIDFGTSYKDDMAKLSIAVQHQFKDLESRANPPAHVSDPFKGQKEIYQTKKHIVVPKTPTEIRNENFEEIKKGAEYGHISKW